MEEKKTSKKFGEFIKKYRTEEKDMTLREFADLIGISFSHLAKIERGEHVPSKTTVSMIAASLGLEKDKLFLLAGYVADNYSVGIDEFFPIMDEEDSETRRRAAIIEKIKEEFAGADLMFNDLANMTAEQLEEVYDFIKFKLQKGSD